METPLPVRHSSCSLDEPLGARPLAPAGACLPTRRHLLQEAHFLPAPPHEASASPVLCPFVSLYPFLPKHLLLTYCLEIIALGIKENRMRLCLFRRQFWVGVQPI